MHEREGNALIGIFIGVVLGAGIWALIFAVLWWAMVMP